jgi:hypothetical protein
MPRMGLLIADAAMLAACTEPYNPNYAYSDGSAYPSPHYPPGHRYYAPEPVYYPRPYGYAPNRNYNGNSYGYAPTRSYYGSSGPQITITFPSSGYP